MPYKTDPLYQRRMARLARMRPEDLAIVQGVANSAAFADSDMQRYLRDLSIINKGKYQEQSLSQSGEKMGLMRAESAFRQQQTFDAISAKKKDISRSRVPGILNVGLSGLSAYNTFRKGEEVVGYLAELREGQKELTGLYNASSKQFANTEIDPTKRPAAATQSKPETIDDELLKKRRGLRGRI